MMPTDWEELYQRGETPWDKGAPSPGLIDYLAEHPVHGRGLVPGCGTGHDVRALAQTAHQVIGIDVAPSAIAAAQRFSSGQHCAIRGRRSLCTFPRDAGQL